MSYPFDEALRNRLVSNLDRFEPQKIKAHDLKQAAVALIVAPIEEEGASLVVTKRVTKLRNHAGQWALPGGRIDPGETPLEAAQRETEEEIGLSLAQDSLLGRLDDFQTLSGYVISPFVFWASADASMTPNPDEVAFIQQFPVALFDRPDLVRLLPGRSDDAPVLRLVIGDTMIHAPTGAFLLQFYDVAVKGEATRVNHFGQPDWAK